MSALAPVPCSSESDSKQRGSPAPAAVCGTHCLTDRDQHYRRRSEAQPCSVHKVMRTGYRKAFSMSNIGSLMNLRSLMVMLCILSVSCTASRAGGCKEFCKGFCLKVLRAMDPRHRNLTKQEFEKRRRSDRQVGGSHNLLKSASFYWCILLVGVMLAVMFYPTNQGLNLFNGDGGASLIARLAFLIPASAILTGAIIMGYWRSKTLTEAKDYETYNKKVRSNERGITPVIFMTVAMIVTIIVICLVANVNPEDFGKKQTVASLIILGLFTMSGGILGVRKYMNQEPARGMPAEPVSAPTQPTTADGQGKAGARRLAEILNRL